MSGASPSDVFTLATEFATRNIAVATAIALTLAGRVEFAVFATTYFLTEIPLMLCALCTDDGSKSSRSGMLTEKGIVSELVSSTPPTNTDVYGHETLLG